MGIRGRQLLVLLCALAACRGDKEQVEQETQSETVAAAPRVEPLTDAQALAVLTAMSEGAAQAAQTPARVIAAPELRRLVEVVRADHQALQRELRAIADSLKLTPADHAAAMRIRTAAQTATPDTAQVEYGTADPRVLQQQIELHTTLLGVLDSAVIPGMQQQTLLKQYAQAVRPTIAAHLQRARQLELLLRETPRTATTPAAPATTAPAVIPPAPAAVDTAAPAPPPPDTTGVAPRSL